MIKMDMETISAKGPEQEGESSENTAWGILTKLSQSETWEEHLGKINHLNKEKGRSDSIERLKEMDIESLSDEEKDFIKNLAMETIRDRYENDYTRDSIAKLPEVIHFSAAEDFAKDVNETLRYQSESISFSEDAITGGIYLADYRTKSGKPEIYLSTTKNEACRNAEDLLCNMVHESLHYLSNKVLDTQMIDTPYSQYRRHDIVEEGITEMLAQDTMEDLGVTQTRRGYNDYVSFARELSDCVGRDTITNAYLPSDGSRFGIYAIQEKFDNLFTEEENKKCMNSSTFWTLYANQEYVTLMNQGVFRTDEKTLEQSKRNINAIFAKAKTRANSGD